MPGNRKITHRSIIPVTMIERIYATEDIDAARASDGAKDAASGNSKSNEMCRIPWCVIIFGRLVTLFLLHRMHLQRCRAPLLRLRRRHAIGMGSCVGPAAPSECRSTIREITLDERDAWNAIGAALCASGVFVIAMALMGQVGVAWFVLCIQFQYTHCLHWSGCCNKHRALMKAHCQNAQSALFRKWVKRRGFWDDQLLDCLSCLEIDQELMEMMSNMPSMTTDVGLRIKRFINPTNSLPLCCTTRIIAVLSVSKCGCQYSSLLVTWCENCSSMNLIAGIIPTPSSFKVDHLPG